MFMEDSDILDIIWELSGGGGAGSVRRFKTTQKSHAPESIFACTEGFNRGLFQDIERDIDL